MIINRTFECDTTINLKRFAYLPDMTLGKIRYRGNEFFTVENPWNNNSRFVSCVPEGVYDLKMCWYSRCGYDAYELINVDGRDYIKIHKGNFANDLKGCIAIGEKLGVLAGCLCVINTAKAFKLFMDLCGEGDQPENIIIEGI